MRITLPNLTPGTNYVIKARSKSGAVTSEWSRNFTFTSVGDTVAPKTPAGVTGSMSGTSFVLKWNAVTQNADNSPLNDFNYYEVSVKSSGSANTGTYITKDTKFEFSFEQNVNLFGTPQANVQMAVRAVDVVGNPSAYSSFVSQTNPAPSAPTGFAGTAGNYSLSFTWNAVSDLDLKQYRIYSGTTAGTQGTLVWTGTALNATVQINDTTTDRWYKVVAVDVFNTESATSNVVGPIKPTSPVSVDTTAPAVPTNLAGTLTNSTDGKTASMAVTWTGVADSDLDSYIIGFRQTATPVNDWQYAVVDRSLTSTTIQGLVPYKAYDIRIRAKDYSANYSNWATIVNVSAQANTAPAVPTGLAVTAGRDNLQISWNENSEPDMANNAGTYDVTVATNSGFTTGVLQYRTGGTTLSVNGLATNTQYWVRVRATDSGGLPSAYSASANATTSNFPSTALSDGNVPTGAVTLSASGGLGYIYLNWTPLANADPLVYDVYMSTTSGFTTFNATTKITEVSGTSAMIDTVVGGASLAYGTTYYFKVIARDRDGASTSVSNQASASASKVAGADSSLTAGDVGAETPTGAQTKANAAQSAAILAANKVNNPSKTGTTDNWAGTGSPTLAIEDKDFFGTSIKAMKVTAANDSQILSDYFDVDINKAYEVRFWVQDPTNSAGNSTQFYLGTNFTTTAGVNVPVTTITPATGAQGVAQGNPYFYSTSGETAVGDWREHVAYVFPYGAVPAEMAGLGKNASAHYQFVQNVTKMRLRFLNWNNVGTPRDLWVANITVTEMTTADLRSATLVEAWRQPNTTTINGGVIATNSVYTKSLAVGDFFNYLDGGDFESTSPALNNWTLGAGASYDTAQSHFGTRSLKIIGNGASTTRASYLPIATTAGTKYAVSFWVYRDASWNGNVGNSKLRVGDQVGAFVAAYDYAAANIPSAVWTRVTGTFTVPAGVSALNVTLANDATAGNVWIDDVELKRMQGGEVIVDGSLSASAFAANTAIITDLFIGTGGSLQSTGYNPGVTGFKLSRTGLTIEGAGNTVSASVLKGGTVTATTLTIGAGGVIVIDSTAALRSNNYAIGSTGYRLDSSGLEVNDGTIDAKTLKTGSAIIGDLTIGQSANSLGTIKSFDYSSGTAGWKIGKGLFEVNGGVIKAAALQLQDGQNIVAPEYAGFEFNPNFYNSKVTLGAGNTFSVVSGSAKYGSQVGRFTATSASSNFNYFGTSATDYNIPLEAGESYILSGWVRSNVTTVTNFSIRVRTNDGVFVVSPTITPNTTWQRLSGVFTAGAGVTSGMLMSRADFAAAGDYVELDGLQLERKIGGINTPSPWTPPGTTSADGGFLRTGEIRSNSTVTVNGTVQPAWSINLSGGAQFGDAAIRGALVVGPTTSTNMAPNSGTFESNVTGYTAYSVGGTGVTLTRTTTAGEVISGTGSMKIGWTTIPSTYGFSINTDPFASIPAASVVKLSFKVRGISTNTTAGENLRAQFLDASNNVLYTTPNMLPTPTYLVSGAVTTINYNAVLPDGIANTRFIRVIINKPNFPPDSTGIVFDDVIISTGDDLGASSVTSGNYIKNDTGWKLSSGGVAEFNNVIVRGGFESATSGLRWRIGSTPQWYGDSAEIIAYSDTIATTVPPKFLANGGGIYMRGAQATDVQSLPVISVGNQNFLDSAPNLYAGQAEVRATNVYINAVDGPSAVGTRFGSNIYLQASEANDLYSGGSKLTIRSTGSDGQSRLSAFSNGDVIVSTLDYGPGTGKVVMGALENGTYIDSSTETNYGSAVSVGARNVTLHSLDGLKGLAGNITDQMMWTSRAVDMLTGGGILNVDTSFNISWSQRFMAIALGRGSTTFVGGFLAITMPAVGTVIPAYAGGTSATVTANGIPLQAWNTLWYEPTFGGSGATSDDSAFRIVGYTTTDFTVPPHWIPIAVRNNDLGMVYFGNGVGYTPWTNIPLSGWTAFDAAGTGYRQPQYRKNSFNEVQLRGMIKHATASQTGAIGAALPAGFRPSEVEAFLCVAGAAGGVVRVNVQADGIVFVALYGASGNANYISLSGIKYQAD